ncbi:hypothetical protein Tco_0847667 [Tanacetum coccineum]
MNIIKNHPLRFNIAASASVPWIYMAQFWHTLREDVSKNLLKFLLDRKELTLTLDDFRTIFLWDLQWNYKTEYEYSRYLVFYSLGRRYMKNEATEHLQDVSKVFGLDVPPDSITADGVSPGKRIGHLASALVPSAEKADEMILQDMIQVSLAEHKSYEEQEARENVALVYEHLAAEEIEKLVEDPENVNDSSPPRHNDTSIPSTRLEPRSDKESPEVEIV